MTANLKTEPEPFLVRLQRWTWTGFLLFTTAVHASSQTNPAPRSDRGLSYYRDEVSEVPWSIHVAKVDRANPDYEIHTTLGQGTALGMGIVSEQVKSLPRELGRPVLAINGDFYHSARNYPGDPNGLQIWQGELVSAPCDRACFWIDAGGNPRDTNVLSQFKVTWPNGATTPVGLNEERAADAAVLFTGALGASTHTGSDGIELVLERSGDAWLPLRVGENYSVRVREVREKGDTPLNRDTMVLSLGSRLAGVPKPQTGMRLQISTATIPDLSGARTAIGGGPTLVRAGKAMQWNGSQPRHPRTAIGWNSNYIFFVEVDGRQRNLSAGMSFPELAAYMVKLGCDEAVNLDGGGSATFWVYGDVVNSPSEGHERPAANALVVIHRDRTLKVEEKPD